MNSVQHPLPRKHVPAHNYASYTQQFPLFAPLDAQEESDLRAGQKIFQSKHPETLVFPEPFPGRRQPAQAAAMADTRIVTGKSAALRQAAIELAARISRQWGTQLEIVEDSSPAADLDAPYPLVLLGGSHENQRTLEFARRYQLGLFCSNFPGAGGWGMTTHWEPEAGIPPRFILGFDAQTVATALDAFAQRAPDASSPGNWSWVHEVHPGADHPLRQDAPQDWIGTKAIEDWFPLLKNWAAGNDSRPYSEVFVEFYTGLQKDYPDAVADGHVSMPSNYVALDIGINAIRYFQASGRAEGLAIFRETLWGYWLYLNTDNPTIYVSNIDFRLGKLCAYWSWIEHCPEISAKERETIPILLLGLTRMVHDYYCKHWKHRRHAGAARKEAQNHQTFKCSSLAQAWRYFARWDLPDRPGWKAEADALFAPLDPAAYKHTENAGNYETFVPEHRLVWMETTRVEIPPVLQEALAWFAWREWMLRDNFFLAVDYGDNNPVMGRSRPFEVGAWIGNSSPAEVRIGKLERSSATAYRWQLPNAVRNFTGLTIANPGLPFDGPSGWQLMPLDPGFGGTLDLSGTAGTRFDKLAWRSGWKPDSAFIAIEGIGNQTISHAHNEANGILRINFAGRIWAVSNGYGKRAGIADASKAYRTRQLGPEEHNMLVVRQPDAKAALPPFNAVLLDHQTEPLPHSASMLRGYAGVDWLRLIVALGDSGFLVLDRVLAADGNGPLPDFELQWNLLGCRSEIADGDSILEQNGCRAVVCHFGTAAPEWKPSPVTVWNKLVESGAYRHTTCLPHQCILRPPSMQESGAGHCFVTGFWMESAVQDVCWDAAQSRLSLRLQGDRLAADSRSEGTWGWIELHAGRLQLQLAR